MKVYNTIEELKADVVNNNLVIEDDITIKFNLDEPKLNISAWDIKALDIKARNISAEDIKAGDIKAKDISAWDINAQNIKARNISARNIIAGDIKAWDIIAWNIKAGDIKAWDIKAGDISAEDISYYAVCFVHKNFICKSIKGRRENSKHFSLDGEKQEEAKQTIDDLLQEIFEVICENVETPAGQGCGYGITEHGQEQVKNLIEDYIEQL